MQAPRRDLGETQGEVEAARGSGGTRGRHWHEHHFGLGRFGSGE